LSFTNELIALLLTSSFSFIHLKRKINVKVKQDFIIGSRKMQENIQENDSYRFRIFQEVQTTYAIPFLNYPFRVGQSKNRIALDLGSNIGGFPIVFSKKLCQSNLCRTFFFCQ
jgi:hypothetical protein